MRLLNNQQRPELVQIEAQIAHSTRKRDNSSKVAEQVQKDMEKQRTRLERLQRDLEMVRAAADEAQGRFSRMSIRRRLYSSYATEAQRTASRGDLNVTEQNLEEYRRLSVLSPSYLQSRNINE